MTISTAEIADCVFCGWNYPQELLARYARGEVSLDPLPTHRCQPS